MKPCRKNKQPIAGMAAGVLKTATAATLHEHMEGCPGCRRYWESMCALSERLNSAELPEAELAESFHRRVVRKIDEDGRAARLLWPPAVHRLWGEQRLATIMAGAALGIATLVWIQNFWQDEDRASGPVRVENISEAPRQPILAPTLASYHRAADVSLENLDAVLARQTAPKPSTVETFTVSSLLARSIED